MEETAVKSGESIIGLYLNGIKLLEEPSRHEEGISALERLLELSPCIEPEVLFMIGEAYYLDDNKEKASSYFDRYLETSPILTDDTRVMMIGNTYNSVGRIDKQIAVLEKILPAKRDEKNGIFLLELGLLYSEVGRNEDAEKLIGEWKASLESIDNLNAPEFYHAAEHYVRVGDYVHARKLVKEGIDNSADWYYDLTGNIDPESPYKRRGLDRDGDFCKLSEDIRINLTLGIIAEKINETEKAKSFYDLSRSSAVRQEVIDAERELHGIKQDQH